MKKTLIFDGNHQFIRHYAINPSISSNGDPIGGCVGFLKSLQYILNSQITADKVIVVWDSERGSVRKRGQFKDYKKGRKPLRHLNRNIDNLTEEDKRVNIVWQTDRLRQYLHNLPIYQLYIDGLEADEIIAETCHNHIADDEKAVIVSSDLDFVQLLSDKVVMYRPTQNEIITKKSATEKYGISPINFALARSISGDQSDNIKGVPSVGLKTIAKKFPFLQEEKQYKLDNILDHSREILRENKNLKSISNILKEKHLIEKNYRIIQLYSVSMPVSSRDAISYVLNHKNLLWNRTGFATMLSVDGFSSLNWNGLFSWAQNITK